MTQRIFLQFLVLCVIAMGCSHTPAPTKTSEENADSHSATERKPATTPALPKALKKRVLVIPFINKSGLGGEELSESATAHTKELVSNTEDLLLVPNEDIEGHESFISEDKKHDLGNILSKAKSYGIAGVITGAIEELGIRERGEEVGFFRTRYHTVAATVQLALYDVASEKDLINKKTTAEITEEHTQFFSGSSSDRYDAARGKTAVTKAIDKVLVGLASYAKRMAWAGRIAKVDWHRYYINVGEKTGISRGQLLGVYGEGQPVFDQETNVLIGITSGNFKGVLKVIDYFGQDGTVAVVHSGGGFKERDRVELYRPPQN
ncbi:MAG: hypothetical protein HY537_05265 [Deltaproteobacteria bacterium]|nr:hypothetical protein [Deltaproteobacteria bacterium]